LPVRLPTGAVGRKVLLDELEGWRVNRCPLLWPDIERRSSASVASESAEEIKQKELQRAAYFQRYDNRPGRSMNGAERAYLFKLFKDNGLELYEIGRVVKTARVVDGMVMVKVDDEFISAEEVYPEKTPAELNVQPSDL